MPHKPHIPLSLDHKWLVVVVLTLGMFMSIMDHTIVNVAVPVLQRGWEAPLQQVQWVVTIYMLTQAAVIPAAPYLARRWGEKRAYIWTLVAFLIGSLLCGLAWNLPSLIVFRFVQGIGGGILLPLVTTLLYQTFPAEERGTASGVMGVPLMVAPVAGPVLGGYLVQYWGWQWAFLINLPIGIVAVAIAQRVLRPSHAEGGADFDGTGFATAAGGSVALLYGASALAGGDTSLIVLAWVAVGVALLAGFVLVETRQSRHGRKPLLDLRRFGDRTFALSVAALCCHTFVLFGVSFLVTNYLQTVRAQTANAAGAILGAQAIATLVALPIAGRMADTRGGRPVVLVGMVLFAAVVAALTLVLSVATPVWVLVMLLAVLGVAVAMARQIPVTAMSGISKDEHAEVANGSTLMSVLRAFAAPLGVAVLSSIAQARSVRLRANLEAGGITGDALQQQSTLLGMHTSFAIGAAVLLVGFVLMYRVPRRPVPVLQPDLATT